MDAYALFAVAQIADWIATVNSSNRIPAAVCARTMRSIVAQLLEQCMPTIL